MRLKHLTAPAALLTAAALTLTGCSSDASDHVKTGKLDEHGKAVVDVWYDVSPDRDRKRLEGLQDTEVLAAVNAFRLLCVLPENRIADALTKSPNQLSKDGAAELADAIEDHLCTAKGMKKPSATPSKPQDNASHDLSKPTSRHDREDATLRVPAEREPAWTHTDTGAGHKHRSSVKAPAAPAAKPVAPAARPVVKSGR
jgi:hypothetical protein